MLHIHPDIPEILLDRLELDAHQERDLGRLGNRLIKVKDKTGGPAFLKIGAGLAGQDLLDEADRLDWLGDRLPVPKILHKSKNNGQVFVLMTELPGKPIHECLDDLTVPVALEKFAEALKMIHGVTVDDCPFINIVRSDLAESARRVQSPDLDIDAFRKDAGGLPADIFKYLSERAASVKETIFTHGDFCFPNLLIDGDKIGGIVDWGIAGVSNKNRDFMSVELTIRRNCGEKWIPAFYDAYGGAEVDHELTRFFWLLDRYFSHYENQSASSVT